MSQSVRNFKIDIGFIQEGDITLNPHPLKSFHHFTYHLLFKPTDDQEITIQPSPNAKGQYQISVPLTEENHQAVLRSTYSAFLILFSQTVTIEREGRYKAVITKYLTEWGVDIEWKKGPNYYKVVLPGTSKIVNYDIAALENICLQSDSLCKKSLSYMKTRNAYFYCQEYFHNVLLHKLLRSYENQIEHEYDEYLEELHAMYHSLAAWSRVGSSGKKVKEISWSTLKNQINDKILKKNQIGSPTSSFEEAIQETIDNIIEEEYSIQLQSWPHETLTVDFYDRIATSAIKSMEVDKKCSIFLHLFTRRVFEDFEMKGPQLDRKRAVRTTYAYNKKLREVMKKVSLIEKRHQLQKENLFTIIKQKEQEMQRLTKAYAELTSQKQRHQEEEEERQKKDNMYLEKKIEELKKKTLFEIKETDIKHESLGSPKAKVTHNGKPYLGLHKKSHSEQHILKPSIHPSQKTNFIEKNKKVQRSLNTSKQQNLSKQNLNTEVVPKGRKVNERGGQKKNDRVEEGRKANYR